MGPELICLSALDKTPRVVCGHPEIGISSFPGPTVADVATHINQFVVPVQRYLVIATMLLSVTPAWTRGGAKFWTSLAPE